MCLLCKAVAKLTGGKVECKDVLFNHGRQQIAKDLISNHPELVAYVINAAAIKTAVVGEVLERTSGIPKSTRVVGPMYRRCLAWSFIAGCSKACVENCTPGQQAACTAQQAEDRVKGRPKERGEVRRA